MQIQQLQPTDNLLCKQAAELLTLSFTQAQDWQTPEGALEEVENILDEGVAFVAIDHDGNLLGWIGALKAYNDNTWELHPLAVKPEAQKQGIGRALVERLEQAAQEAGIWTMMLGTDDEDNRTTLSLIDDLYADPYRYMAEIRNRDESNPHPFSFYQRLGYKVVGILPDANGPHRPDIFMAKRLR